MPTMKQRFPRVLAALATFLLVATVAAQETCSQLTLMSWAHFLQGSDAELQAVLQRFGEERGIDVRLDTVALSDVPSRTASAVQSQAGPDVILLMNYSTALYADQMLSLDDTIGRIEDFYGPFWEVGQEASQIDGTWRSIPWFYTPAPANVRPDYFEAAGLELPDTWAELLEAAGPLAAAGHPVGLAISNAGDSNDWLLQMMASFGASAIDADGNVAIDSAATRAALDYVKALFAHMPPDVLGWDGGGNNQLILTGFGSWTINPVSVYVSAKRDLPQIAENLDHTLPPAGPEGRFATTSVYTLGVPQWTPCPETAKDLVVFLFQPENYESWVTASGGYNVPLFQEFPNLPVWQDDPKLAVPQELGAFMHLALWPAPPQMGAALQEIYDTYIIPAMFARAIQGETNDQAIAWAEEQIQQIVSR